MLRRHEYVQNQKKERDSPNSVSCLCMRKSSSVVASGKDGDCVEINVCRDATIVENVVNPESLLARFATPVSPWMFELSETLLRSAKILIRWLAMCWECKSMVCVWTGRDRGCDPCTESWKRLYSGRKRSGIRGWTIAAPKTSCIEYRARIASTRASQCLDDRHEQIILLIYKTGLKYMIIY